MVRRFRLALLLVLLIYQTLGAAEPPLALLVEVAPLGQGANGTVVGIVLQVAPEDRGRAGKRVRIATTLRDGQTVLDSSTAVVELQADGTANLYREWPPGSHELLVAVAAVDGTATGGWSGTIEVATATAPFEAPADAPPDAVALGLSPPRQGIVRFLPPQEIGGIGGVQLEVEVPEGTTAVEFLRDGKQVVRRNRPPWTVSVPLGEVVRRTVVTAVAMNDKGDFLGEDAIVLNNPTGQLGVEILIGPPGSAGPGRQTVTVAVTGSGRVHQVLLELDSRPLARWADCPCVTEVGEEELAKATLLTATAEEAGGTRGEAVLSLHGGGFSGSVTVELVELPVVVLDQHGTPVPGLAAADFRVFEDGGAVELEGFGTTADLPLDLALAVDVSGSMSDNFADVRKAVEGFAKGLLGERDHVLMLTFSWEAKVVMPWPGDPAAIAARLERVVPEGGTSLHDAVVRSLEQFRGRRGRQALVLLTDGEDTTSRTGWEVAQRFAHTMRIPIFPIGLGVSGLDFEARRVLNRLAEDSGGAAFYPGKVEELPAVYARISELLRSQYLLWYRSGSTKPVEELRTIRVEVSRPGVVVKTIRGYYPGK